MREQALYKKDEDKLLIKQVIQAIVADENSVTINELIQEIIDDKDAKEDEQKIEMFCDRYELGNWFYDAMVINDVDIIEELNGIWMRKRIDEAEANEEDRLIQQERERASAL